MKDNELYQAAHLELIQQLNEEHNWGHSQASLCDLLIMARPYLDQANSSDDEISKVLFYFVTEHPAVESMQRQHDPHYNQQWENFRKNVEKILSAKIRANYPEFEDVIEDVVHEAIITVLKSLHKFKYKSTFGTWTYVIIVKTLFSYLRRYSKKNGQNTSINNSLDIVSDGNLEDQLENKEKIEKIFVLLYKHKDRVFDIVYEHFIKDTPGKILAEQYKCSASTITRTIQNALEYLENHPDISNWEKV